MPQKHRKRVCGRGQGARVWVPSGATPLKNSCEARSVAFKQGIQRTTQWLRRTPPLPLASAVRPPWPAAAPRGNRKCVVDTPSVRMRRRCGERMGRGHSRAQTGRNLRLQTPPPPLPPTPALPLSPPPNSAPLLTILTGPHRLSKTHIVVAEPGSPDWPNWPFVDEGCVLAVRRGGRRGRVMGRRAVQPISHGICLTDAPPPAPPHPRLRAPHASPRPSQLCTGPRRPSHTIRALVVYASAHRPTWLVRCRRRRIPSTPIDARRVPSWASATSSVTVDNKT